MIAVTVCLVGDTIRSETVSLAAGSTLSDAVKAAGFTEAELAGCETGVFGKKRPGNHVLSDGDRVDICAALPRSRDAIRRGRQGSGTD